MTKAPERIWAAVDSLYPEQDGGTWVSEICSGVEYTRTDHVLALVAVENEACAEICDVVDESRKAQISENHNPDQNERWRVAAQQARLLASNIRARTPDDATAALKARDARIRNEALREIANLADKLGWHCAGCGRLCRDPEKDLELLRKAGARSCCPEREMEPLSAPILALITEGQSDG